MQSQAPPPIPPQLPQQQQMSLPLPPPPQYHVPQFPTVHPVRGSQTQNRNGEIIKMLTNRVLDLIMIEINKDDMKENIKKKIVNPLMYMIYSQLCPYIYTFITVILLMFVILIVILVFFIFYLKK